jgi:hypothetical protein
MRPRKFQVLGGSIRGECREVDGEKVVDTACDLYDSKESAKELERYADWLRRAAKWLQLTDSDN